MTLGICCSELAIIPDAARVLSDIAAFGFKKVRFEVPWVLVEPVKGQRNWAPIVNVVNLAKQNGVELLPILGVHAPTWSWTAADYGSFCGDAAKVIGAPRYECWNEPNLAAFHQNGDAYTYVPQLSAASKAIKAIQPNAQIVMGGLAACEGATGFNWWFWLAPFGWWTNVSPEDFLQDALNVGANQACDLIGYHPYSIDAGFNPQAPNASQVMIARIPKLAGIAKKPLLLTEWGFDHAKIDANTSAAWFQTQLALLPYDSFLYTWRDYGTTKYGLVDGNNIARQPIYNAVHAVVAGQAK